MQADPRRWPPARFEAARLVEEAGDEQLAEQVDQAAAADADGGASSMVRNVGSRGVVDADVLDGAGSGAHAVPDAAALEGRAGGTGAGDQPVLVAQDHLAVRADVDEQA